MVLRFKSGVAVQAGPLNVQVETLEDGSTLWRAEVTDLQAWLPWIRSWGPACEVMEPQVLREQLRQEARTLARQYGWYVSAAPATPEVLFDGLIEEGG